MVFPKWHLSLKDLLWGFSLSVLLLEEKAEPTFKPTLSLFLGEPLCAGAMRSLLTSITLQPPSPQAVPRVSWSPSLVQVTLGDAAPPTATRDLCCS